MDIEVNVPSNSGQRTFGKNERERERKRVGKRFKAWEKSKLTKVLPKANESV